MKKVIILNGSPRKNWNTYKMCESFANGVRESGNEAEIINLYDIDFKGCRSCFACKLKDGKNFGRCAYPDGLTPILDKIAQSDGVVFGTPIYYGDITGVMKSCVERLLFPFFEYKEGFPSIAPKKLKTAIIYTMNVDEKTCQDLYSAQIVAEGWAIQRAMPRQPPRQIPPIPFNALASGIATGNVLLTISKKARLRRL